MKLTSLLIVGALWSFSLAARADAVVGDSAVHDCTKEPAALIDGAGANVKFVGTCEKIEINSSSGTFTIEAAKKVLVNGAGNKVDIGGADKIVVTGAGNTVTYKKGLSTAKPKVTSVGAGNKVSRGS
jgi:uncharacterized protein (DUF2345 family)